MTQRLRNRRHAFNDHPFTGEGTSVYADVGGTVRYRNLRVIGRHTKWVKGGGGNHDIAGGVAKTARRAFALDPDASIDVDLAAAGLLPDPGETQQVTFDVRTFRDDCENESDNSQTVTKTIDENGDEVNAILGTAAIVGVEVRAGGIVRLRFVWTPSVDGVQPNLFRATRTAGPTVPADSTVSYSSGRLVEIDTEALQDGGMYTYQIQAENGATTKLVITAVTFTADASGPAAPVFGRSEDY